MEAPFPCQDHTLNLLPTLTPQGRHWSPLALWPCIETAYCSADGEQRHGRRKHRFLKVLTTHFLSPALMPQGRLYIFCWRRNRLMLPERGEQRENPIKHFF